MALSVFQQGFCNNRNSLISNQNCILWWANERLPSDRLFLRPQAAWTRTSAIGGRIAASRYGARRYSWSTPRHMTRKRCVCGAIRNGCEKQTMASRACCSHMSLYMSLSRSLVKCKKLLYVTGLGLLWLLMCFAAQAKSALPRKCILLRDAYVEKLRKGPDKRTGQPRHHVAIRSGRHVKSNRPPYILLCLPHTHTPESSRVHSLYVLTSPCPVFRGDFVFSFSSPDDVDSLLDAVMEHSRKEVSGDVGMTQLSLPLYGCGKDRNIAHPRSKPGRI